jgi:Taurine catabolism dioxygenase TauD, TfdA family/Gamma-butyrobetaine hydroxylase-like, N-terminal
MSVLLDDDVLRVEFEDGRSAELHVRALRDGCPCAECRHPVSGQRLFETLAVVPQARAVAAATEDGALRVEWADGHVSTSDALALAGEPEPRRPTLWDSQLGSELPRERYADVIDDPAAMRRWLLATRPVLYAYRDRTADLSAHVPVLALDPAGTPSAVRVNNRSKAVPSGPADAVGEWYDAYLDLLAILHSPDAQVRFRLEPGDVIVFDNVRVLHGRTDFAGTGTRRLQGCYADRDALPSALRLLERAAA